MTTLEKHLEYSGKFNNYTSYVDSNGVEYIAVLELLKNFYIRELYDDLSKHENLICANIDNTEIKVLEKEMVVDTLKHHQKICSNLKESMRIAETVKKLHTNSEIVQSETTNELYKRLKINEIVKVRVCHITSYGVMVELVEDSNIQGIIHISEIVDGFVTNIEDYFSPDDTIDAKIVKKLPNEFKINCSTKDLIEKVILDKQIQELKEKEVLDENIVEEIVTNINDKSNDIKLPPEYAEIEEYIKSKTGDLSNDAKLKLMELIEHHGIFKFSVKIGAVSENMSTDVGLLFLNKVEQVLGN